jgi:transposase
MVNVGVDLHKTQFTVCARRNGEQKFGKFTTQEEGYQEFFAHVSAWQEDGEEVRVAVESTGNTRYFKNRMEDAGLEVKVINTLKMKVVNESVKKTDKHDAATIAEFLEKDMLPEAQLCSRESEQLRRLLKVRTSLVKTQTVLKNQIHALISSEGLEAVKSGALQSKKGRKEVLNALNQCENGLVAQPLLEMLDRLEQNVNSIEKQLRTMVKGDRTVELLMTIPGCGEICSWTIRAYTDDIKRFANPKKYTSFAGLAPWVQNSNETIRHGKITKRGPKELRTALVQVVMGLRRMKAKTFTWHLVKRYDLLKQSKGSGKAIIATARKVAVIIWHMLTREEMFKLERVTDPKLAKKAQNMRKTMGEKVEEPQVEKREKPVKAKCSRKKIKTPGVAREKKKNVG